MIKVIQLKKTWKTPFDAEFFLFGNQEVEETTTFLLDNIEIVDFDIL